MTDLFIDYFARASRARLADMDVNSRQPFPQTRDGSPATWFLQNFENIFGFLNQHAMVGKQCLAYAQQVLKMKVIKSVDPVEYESSRIDKNSEESGTNRSCDEVIIQPL